MYKSEEEIIQIINKLIIEKGVTKTSLSETTGYGRPKIYSILAGQQEISFNFLVKFCLQLNIPIEDLIFQSKTMRGMDNDKLLEKIMKLSEEVGRLKKELEDCKSKN